MKKQRKGMIALMDGKDAAASVERLAGIQVAGGKGGSGCATLE